VATVGAFRHGTGRHVDPAEERWSSATVVATTHGAWRYRDPRGAVDAMPGLVILGPAHQDYRVAHDGARPEDRGLFIQVDPTALGSGGAEILEEAFARPAVPNVGDIARAITLLGQRSLPGDPFSGFRMDVWAMELLLALVDSHRDGRTGDRPPSPEMRERLHLARRIMDERLAEPVDLTTLASEVSVSRFHLSRLFLREFGEPPHTYLIRRRLERARELLETTQLSVTQVATRCGFASPSHFAERFRKRFGTTPSLWRSSHSAED
jgi:AraC-like DNA-binding protein